MIRAARVMLVFVMLIVATVAGLRGTRRAGAQATPPDSVRTVNAYPTDLPDGPGKERVEEACLICHSAMIIAQQHKDSTAWRKTVTQMVTWGAPVDSVGRPELERYLVARFGPAPKTAGKP